MKVLLFLDPYSHEGFRNPHDKGNEAVWLIPLVSPALAGLTSAYAWFTV